MRKKFFLDRRFWGPSRVVGANRGPSTPRVEFTGQYCLSKFLNFFINTSKEMQQSNSNKKKVKNSLICAGKKRVKLINQIKLNGYSIAKNSNIIENKRLLDKKGTYNF